MKIREEELEMTANLLFADQRPKQIYVYEKSVKMLKKKSEINFCRQINI